MTRTHFAWLAVLALVASACGAEVLGPGIPECNAGLASDPVSSATVLQLQAVPEAAWGPCIEELRVGWDYVPQQAESGRAVFWLDSDRVGSRFVEVELTESCDTSGMQERNAPLEDMDLHVRVDEEPGEVEIAIVPVAERHVGDARALVTKIIGTQVKGRSVAPFVDESDGLPADRISRLVREVGIVMVLDDAQVTTGTVELRRRRGRAETDLSIDDAMDEIAHDLPTPRYRAEYAYTFDGGCITYRFDAAGIGVGSISAEVRSSLGFYPLAVMRSVMADLGLIVGPEL